MTTPEEKAQKMLTRISQIASERILHRNFSNPYERHKDSNDALLNVIYQSYEEILREKAERELEEGGLAKAYSYNNTKILELLNKGFRPILITEGKDCLWLYKEELDKE